MARWGNNTGKTTGGAREDSWALQGTHPYRNTIPKTGINIAIASNKLDQAMEIMLPRIEAFFEGTSFTLVTESLKRRVWICPQTGNRLKIFAFSQAKQQLRGYAIHLLHLDEVPQDDGGLWEELHTRLTKVGGDLIITATPEDAMWVRDKIELNEHMDVDVIRGSTWDNLHNLPDRKAVEIQAKSLPSSEYKMRFLGEYGVYSGSVYSQFDRRVHLVSPQEFEAFRAKWRGRVMYFTGTDFTQSDRHEGATLWVAACREARKAFIFREYVATGVDQHVHANAVVNLSREPGYRLEQCDPRGMAAIPEWQKVFKKAKRRIMPAPAEDIMEGVVVAQQMLAWAGTPAEMEREPMLYLVQGQTVKTVKEIESYIFDEATGKPMKTKKGHNALDAMRYIIKPVYQYLNSYRKRIDKPPETLLDRIKRQVTMVQKLRPEEYL